MNHPNEATWLTIAWFILGMVFGTLYFIEKADNSYLEERYHQCSGRYY